MEWTQTNPKSQAENSALRKQLAEKDLCLKKIVGYAFSSHIDTNLTVSALEMAVNRQKPQENLIFHSDRGVQYASGGYREALSKHNITQSMSRKGDPYDNAVAENFFSCLKCELVHHKHYKTKDEAQADIFAYIETYFCSFSVSIFVGMAQLKILLYYNTVRLKCQ